MSNIALIFAGGVGVRMNTKALPKQFLELHGKPILIHTLEAFEKSPLIDAIILVMVKDYIDYSKNLLLKFNISKVKTIVEGGSTGQNSIYNGLVAAKKYYKDDDVILIHDGVRPVIDNELIEKNVYAVLSGKNIVTAARARETIVLCDDGILGKVEDRSKSYIAKAPQSFFIKRIMDAHKKAMLDNLQFIDSCSLMQHYGYPISIIECGNDNIKITTPEDFYVFRALIDKKENEQLL